MTKRFSILLVVLTIVSGLIGGAITGRIFTPKVAIAEEAAQSKVLTVEGLRVVDKDGKLLIVLGNDAGIPNRAPLDNYGLFILDKSGSVRANMEADGNGGSFMASGKGGVSSMGVDESGGIVSVYGKYIKSKAVMGLYKDSGAVSVFSNAGKGVAMMTVDESGGNVSVSSKEGKGRAAMGADESSGHFGTSGEDGITVLGVEASGSCFSASGKDGKPKVGIDVDESGGNVHVFGKDAKGGAIMMVDESGGHFSAFGKGNDEERASMGINKYGNGVIGLWDKNGNKIK
jgi:hypothetical protein